MEKYTQDEAIAYECAREVITHLMAIQTAKIEAESNKPCPDAARLSSLNAERSRLHAERSRLHVDSYADIARIRAEYGAVIRKWMAEEVALPA